MLAFIQTQKTKFFRIAKVAIFIFSFFLIISSCLSQEPIFSKSTDIVNVYITKKADSYQINDLEVVIGDFSYLPDFKFWKGKASNGCIISFQGNTLGCFAALGNLTVIECSDRIIDDKMTGGCVEKPEGEVLIQMPYFPNGKYTDIFDSSGKKVLTIDLSSKATCNENDKCDQPVEDSVNCPQDCRNNEPVITAKSAGLTPAAPEKAVADDTPDKKIGFADLGWWGIAIVIILIAGGGTGYYVYRKNREF